MTVSIFADEEYVADVGTNSGWFAYTEWLAGIAPDGSESASFAEEGWSEEPAALAEELQSVTPDEMLADIHAKITAAAAQAADVVVVTDSTSGDATESET